MLFPSLSIIFFSVHKKEREMKKVRWVRECALTCCKQEGCSTFNFFDIDDTIFLSEMSINLMGDQWTATTLNFSRNER